MSVTRLPFILGLFIGFIGITAAEPMRATMVPVEQSMSVQELARQSWPYLTHDQKLMVDRMARQAFETELAAEQRARIAGHADASFDSLSEWRKSAFRGMAIRDLDLDLPEMMRQAV